MEPVSNGVSPAAVPLRVVYLAGSGHTGSTLLALLADTNPAIGTVGEIAVKPRIRHRGDELGQKCSCGAAIAQCAFWRRVFEQVKQQGLEFGPDNWTNDYRCEHPLVHRLLTRDSSYLPVRRFQAWSAHHLPVFRERIRRIDAVNVAFIRAVLDTKGAQVFFDTSKQALRLTRLLEIPELDVRVVTLVRDVRAYVASARRRGRSVTDAAEAWKCDQLAIRDVTRTLPGERTLLIRYEDLCRDVNGTLQRFWTFCGVPPVDPPATLLSSQHHVLGNNMRRSGAIAIRLDERWRQTLAAQEERNVLRIAGALNRQFGYA